MKTYQRTSVLTLTVAGALLLGVLIPAPEANAARQDADSQSGTPASRAAAGQDQAEATDATAANDATNQPSTTDDITNQPPPQMGVNREAVVVFGKDVELKAGDS